VEFYSVLIIARTPGELRGLERFDFDLKYRAARQEAANRFVVPGIVSGAQIQQLYAAGYMVEVVDDLSRVAEERRREVSPVNRFADARGVAEFNERAVMGYMTADEVESALQNLSTLNPDLITLITLPNTTWEGRTSHAVRLRAGANPNRPGILFTGSMHAREWGGSDICLAFLNNLINAYRANTGINYGGKAFTSTQVHTIIENTDVFVFPDVNPDGKNYSQTHDPGNAQSTWWRKNRNPNTATGTADPGVDVNRNFDFLWGSGVGTSSSPSSIIYKGVSAFSEPETRNVRHLFDAYPNIRYYVDIHSFGELILYSWGDDDNQNTDLSQNFTNPAFNGQRGTPGDTAYREFMSTLDQNTAVAFADRMNEALAAARGKHYTVRQAVGLYPTSATSDDYAFSRHVVSGLKNKVYSYTIEFGAEFVPPFSEMANIIKDVSAAITEMCWAINSDLYVRDSMADIGVTPSSGTFWDSPDVWVRNNDDGGTVHQNTVRGRNNFVYVRVINRGLAEARDAKVRVSITNFAGTQFIYPDDWIPRNPSGGGTLGGTGTYFVGEASIPSVAPGASQVVRVRWDASLIPPDLNWHPCLLVEVSPNDGLPATGSHVWDSNSFAQKNITIVNARRGELVEFAFKVGNKHAQAAVAELHVRRTQGPRTVGVFLDVKDRSLLDSLKSALRPGTNGPSLALQPGGINATLLGATTVALPFSFGGGGGESDLLYLRLPASTRVEIQEKQVERALKLQPQPQAAGFSLVTLDTKPLLALSASEQGRLRLPLNQQELKSMSLIIALPKDATGDMYEFEVAQYDSNRRAVGGVKLQINIVS
jgi:carboxypeptidase T